MAIAIDASSPARVAGTPATNVDITSASFTPPNNSILVVCVSADTQGTGALVFSVRDSIDTTTGWTSRVHQNPSGSIGGACAIWTKAITTGQAMTVSVRRTSGSGGTNRLSMKVYVVTGGDTSSPAGNTGQGTSTTINITPNAYTSSVNNSRGFGCATDWSPEQAPTSTDEEDAAFYSGHIGAISLYKAADTASSGSTVTVNFNAGTGATPQWTWVALEIKPAASSGQTVSPSSITSAEAIGSPKVNLTVSPTAVASAGAFGSPQLNLAVSPTGMASDAAFGTPKVNLAASPTAIASAESFGSPKVNLTVSPGAISSGVAFGTPTVSGANTLLTDLVSYWKLNEASGTREDSHGTNDLTDNGTVTSATGKLNDAASFAAANSEFLSVADNSSLAFTDKFSVSMWVWRDSLTLNAAMMGKWTYQTQGCFAIQAGNATASDIVVFIADALTDNGANWGRWPAAHTTGQWYHVVVVYDGTQTGNSNRLKVYQDGSLLAATSFTGTIPASLPADTASLLLGSFGGTLPRYWNGRLDEVALWKRALTSSEVTQLWNSGTALPYESFGGGAGAQTVSPSSITSGESVGSPKLNLTVSPGSISSAGAFGSAKINLQVTPSSITSTESFGSPTLTGGTATVGPAGIASAAAFGTPKLNMQVRPTGIASAQAIGSPTIVLKVSPTGIASAQSIGSPRLNLNVRPAGIVSALEFGLPSVISGLVPVFRVVMDSTIKEASSSPTVKGGTSAPLVKAGESGGLVLR